MKQTRKLAEKWQSGRWTYFIILHLTLSIWDKTFVMMDLRANCIVVRPLPLDAKDDFWEP